MQLRIFIITQNDPFYLGDAMEYLLEILPKEVSLIGALVLNGSPFGKRKSLLNQATSTLKIFGIKFFLFYSIKFIKSKVGSKSVAGILKNATHNVREGSININSADNIDHIKLLNPDIIISIAANQKFSDDLLDLPKMTCLNIHSAKLPKYRGLMPLFWACAHEEKTVGVTVFEMDKDLDSGLIVSQSEVPTGKFSLNALIKQTKYLGMFLLADVLRKYLNGTVEYEENLNSDASYFSFPTNLDVKKFIKTGRKFY